MRANTVIPTCALVALFTHPTAHAGDPTVPLTPDLCEEPVYTASGEIYTDLQGQTISRFCKPRIDPPVLDREICCSIGSKATCKPPTATGRCSSGMKFWCEYGEQIDSAITCYQDGPSACDLGFCNGSVTSGGTVFESTSWLCCNPATEDCTYVGEGSGTPPADAFCAGEFVMCNWGSTNEDGTVTCDN